MSTNDWQVIPTDIIEEMAEAYGVTAGEIIYMIGMDELPSDMKECLAILLDDAQV